MDRLNDLCSVILPLAPELFARSLSGAASTSEKPMIPTTAPVCAARRRASLIDDRCFDPNMPDGDRAWHPGGMSEDDQLSSATLAREALIGDFDRPLRADILLQFAQFGTDQRVVVELVRVRHRRDFFSQLGRAQRLGVPTILVLVGVPDELASLESDIRALSTVDANIRVVPVALDNG